jgi:hypothetical protein
MLGIARKRRRLKTRWAITPRPRQPAAELCRSLFSEAFPELVHRRLRRLFTRLFMEKDEDAFRTGTPPPAVSGERRANAPWWFRLLLVFAGLAVWFWTQSLIGARQSPGDRIGDRLHEWSAPVNEFLHGHPAWADGLLITSSALIDGLGFFLLARSVFWPSIRPFLGLMILLGLRQIFQGLCALPPPEGMIWRYPGFPSLLVTYGVSNDLFFSVIPAWRCSGPWSWAASGGVG